ncbi:MAG TPA: Ig-like domain-containing protein [Solirubrobacteraceae bacterium]|nr:Ig-like domain-containing protein [Solirubrobacteraceae bacterium]
MSALVLIGLPTQRADAQSSRILSVACADRESGLLRYAPHSSGCDGRGEETVVLAKRAPLYACVSPALTLASARRGGHRVVIPRGTMWRAPSVAYCARLQQRGVVLGGRRQVHVCAARRGGLLRYTALAGACHAREIEMLVAAQAHRPKQPREKRPPCCKQPPEPNFVPVADPQSVSTPEGEPVSVILAGHTVDTHSGGASGPVLSFAIVSTPAHGTLTGIPPNVLYTPAPGYHGSDSFTFTADFGAHASAPATVSITVAHVNRAPVLTLPGEQTMEENTTHDFSVVGADAISIGDEDAEAGFERLTLEAKHGSLELGSTKSLTSVEGQGSDKIVASGTIAMLQQALEPLAYTPASGYQGEDSLKLEADDLGHTGLGGAKTTSGSVPISVLPVAYDKAMGDSYSTEENEKLKVAAPGVLANDTDSDGLSLSAEVVKGPEHGSLTLNGDGSFEYTPAHNYTGSDSFTYRDQDGNSASNVATVTLTVKKVVFDKAVDDSYSTDEATKLEASAPGVLVNDTDGDTPSLPLEAVLVSGPVHGSLALHKDGSFDYTPEAGYHGSDSFTYKDEDGNSESNTATVTLTVEQVDQSPSVGVPGSPQSTGENSPLTFSSAGIGAFTAADSDSEGESERVVLTAEHGTLTPGSTSGLEATGSGSAKLTLKGAIAALDAGLDGLTYEPDHDYSGSDAVTIEIDDLGHTGTGGPLTASGGVAIEVTKTAFDKAVDDSYSVEENAELKVAAPGVLVNDTDSDTPSLPLEAVLVSGPVHGLLTLHKDGSFGYTPEAGYHGSDSFTYKDEDGNSESNTATVTLSVERVDLSPSTSVPGSQSLAENSSLVFSSAGANAVSVEDADSEGGAEQVSLSVGHGTLTLGSTSGLEVTGEASAKVALKGTIAALNAGLEGLGYKPAQDYHGGDTLGVEVDDLAHTGVGGPLTATASVPIAVTTVVYDKAVDDSYTAQEDTELKVAAPGVLANDTDSDNPALPLEAKEVTKQPQHGSVTLKSDGSFSYTPESSYTGSDSFSYTDADGNSESNAATVTIEVIAHVNEAPTLTVPSAREVSENTSEAKTSLAFSAAKSDAVSMADADSEGGGERLKLAVEHGVLTPGGESGLTVTGSGTGTLTLEGTVAKIDAGVEGLTYTPTLDYHGADTLSLEADDLGHSGAGGAKTSSSSVAITVAHPNPPPTNPTYSGAIGNTEFSVGVAGSGPDVQVSGSVLPGTTEADGSTLKATAGAIVTEHGGSVSMKEDGTFTYQPPAGYDNASDSFKYTETDSAGGKATGTATIKISGARVWYVNDAEAPSGNGESNSPFKALSSVESASTGSGDVVFLYKGSATYTGGIELKAQQTLEGQSQGLTVESHALVAASGANPTITNATAEAPGVSLASGDTVHGITVESSAGDGIKGAGVNGEVTLTNDTIKGGAEDGIDLIPASSGTLTLDVAQDTISRQHTWAIGLTSGSGATVLGTIAHDTIGEAGTAESGSKERGAIGIQAAGESDTTTVKISENSVESIGGGGYGIWLNATKEVATGKSGATLNATVFDNTIEMRDENSLEGLFAESGNGPSDPETLCLNATENTIKAAGVEGPAAFNADPVLLNVKEGSIFKVQGVSGAGSNAEVEKLLEAKNNLSSLHGEALVFIEAQKSFASGTCPEP